MGFLRHAWLGGKPHGARNDILVDCNRRIDSGLALDDDACVASPRHSPAMTRRRALSSPPMAAPSTADSSVTVH